MYLDIGAINEMNLLLITSKFDCSLDSMSFGEVKFSLFLPNPS